MFNKAVFTSILALASIVVAAPVNSTSDGVLSLDFNVHTSTSKKLNSTSTPAGLETRSGTESLKLLNEDTYYITYLYFGSNKQKIGVDIDTGSSDLWVIDTSAGVQGDYGTFDHSSSSTYKDIGVQLYDAYEDGSYAIGDFGTDSVALGEDGPTLTQFEFGDATEVSEDQKLGILGVGLKTLEGASPEYNNFPIALKNAGLINKEAYSLYLNTEDAESGTILFGGIDNAKYTGSLKRYPVVSSDRLTIHSTGISVSDGYSTGPLDATLDSGSTISYIPSDQASGLASDLGAKWDNENKIYYFDSASSVPDKTISFNFQGLSIPLPKKDLTIPLYDENGNKLEQVGLGVQPSNLNTYGDNFLRNVYAVYNLEDKYIELAPAKYTTASSITTID